MEICISLDPRYQAKSYLYFTLFCLAGYTSSLQGSALSAVVNIWLNQTDWGWKLIAELTSDETDHLVNWSEPTTKDQWWRWINLMGEVYWWISGGWSRKRRGGLPRLHCSKRPPHPPPPPSPSPCPPSPPPPPLLLAVGIIRWACSHAECRTSWFLRKNIWQTVNPPNIAGCKKYWGWIVNHQILLDGLWLSWVEAILGRPNIYSKKYWVHNIGLLTTKYC